MSARDTTRQIVTTLKAHLDELGDGLEQVVGDATDILEIEVRRQAGLTDHTLKELAALGHPYRVAGGGFFSVSQGKRPAGFVGPGAPSFRGGIRKAARLEREGSVGHDLKLVHIQSGDLQSAITREVTRTDKLIIGRVSVDTNKAPHAVFVITGTRKMIPRNFPARGAVIARSRVLQTIRTGLNALFRQIKAAA